MSTSSDGEGGEELSRAARGTTALALDRLEDETTADLSADLILDLDNMMDLKMRREMGEDQVGSQKRAIVEDLRDRDKPDRRLDWEGWDTSRLVR